MELIYGGLIAIVGIIIGSVLHSSRELKNYRRDRLEHFGLSIGEFGYSRRKQNILILDVINYASQTSRDMQQTMIFQKEMEKLQKQTELTQKQMEDSKKRAEDLEKLMEDGKKREEDLEKLMEDIEKQTEETNNQASALTTMSLLYGSELTEYIHDYLYTSKNYDHEVANILKEIKSKMGTYAEDNLEVYTAKVTLMYEKSVEKWEELLRQISSENYKKSWLDKLINF
ncbi:MAG: hypothetical protein IH948_03005 [Bacteroidetes bacterium]|nr:hypothetical protein [Bacteroidota bacterium]